MPSTDLLWNTFTKSHITVWLDISVISQKSSPVTFGTIPVRSIEIFVPENMGIVVGILFLSSLTAEIQVHPVYFVRHIEIPLPV